MRFVNESFSNTFLLLRNHKELIKQMAIYHLSVKIIGRSSGKSAVAAAAYRSGDILINEWDGLTHDYSRKGWIEHTEILLPEHAPKAFQDRNTLWNAVELSEKNGNAQLAREAEVALPIELKFEEQLSLIRNYIQENFVSKGMCADLAIHNPPITNEKKRPVDAEGNSTNDPGKMVFHNPHAHILLTVRPLDETGNWQAKSQKCYLCRKDNEERAIPSNQFSNLEKEGWQKQYQYKIGKKKVWLTEDAAAKKDLKRISREPKSTKAENPITAEWNSKDSLLRWRENWAKMCNQALKENNIDAQIDHRSYEDQGVNKIAQVHLGIDAFYAEKKGMKTELGELNRQIKSDNGFLSRFEKQIEELERKETERVKKTAARLETLRANHIAAAYQQLCLSMALAQQQDNLYTQIQTSAALAKSADRLLKAIELLMKALGERRKELAHTSPIQARKKKELKEKITENEQQIQNLRHQLDEVKARQEQIKAEPVSDPEVMERKKKQIQRLKEIQSQTYREFYTLVKENKEHMQEIRQLIRGSRPEYDTLVKEKLKEHYSEDFRNDILLRAREMAPEIPEAEGEQIHKKISRKK